MRAAVITHHFPHADAEPALERLKVLAAEHECELIFDPQSDSPENAIVNRELVDAKPDVSIVIGGDGSILRSLRTFAGTQVPTFGFNFGTIGFLTTLERDDLDAGIKRALTGDFEVLKLPALRLKYGEIDLIGINDVSLHRSHEARVAEIAYGLGDEQVGKVRCDGIVVATPAGSTGYNLANSGPILAWGVEGFVVSFIAPHTLTARALVAAADDVMGITNAGRIDPLEILIDGLMVGELPVGECAEVTFEDDVAALAQIPGSNFYHRFRDKFGKLAN